LQVEHNQAKHATPVGLQSKTAAKNREAQDTLRGEKKTTKGHKERHTDTQREGEEEEEGGVKRKQGEETRDERFSGGGLEQRRR
jgi:hypothetical protein